MLPAPFTSCQKGQNPTKISYLFFQAQLCPASASQAQLLGSSQSTFCIAGGDNAGGSGKPSFVRRPEQLPRGGENCSISIKSFQKCLSMDRTPTRSQDQGLPLRSLSKEGTVSKRTTNPKRRASLLPSALPTPRTSHQSITTFGTCAEEEKIFQLITHPAQIYNEEEEGPLKVQRPVRSSSPPP